MPASTPLRATVFSALVLALGAWTRPQLPEARAKPAGTRAAQLDYVIVAVNGEPRIVRAGQELAVVRGDRIEIRESALFDRALRPREVNLVGFQGSARQPSDDRGFTVDTGKDLKPRWSEDGRGDLYAIVTSTRSTLHGAAFLRLIQPVLRYAEVTVNGRVLVLRDGESVAVGAKDKVKVQRVVTNLQSDEGVYVQIVPVEPPSDGTEPPAGATAYEIRFLRGEHAFATVPLKVKG